MRQISREILGERHPALTDSYRTTQQHHAVGGKTAKIDGMSAARAADDQRRMVWWAIFSFRLIHAKRGQPPDNVVAAITPRQAPVGTNRQIHLPSRLLQFLGDLRAGCTRTDHQDTARRQLRRIPVAARVDLKKIVAAILKNAWNRWALIRASRQHDVGRLDAAEGCLHMKQLGILRPLQRGNRDRRQHRRLDKGRVILDETHDRVTWRKIVWVSVGERKIRQPHRPIGKLKMQPVPTLRSPAVGNGVAFQHDVGAAELAQPVAHGQPRLPTANNDCVDAPW